MGQWIRNDDQLVYIAHIEGEYKVNLVFYQAMISAPQSMFYLNTHDIRILAEVCCHKGCIQSVRFWLGDVGEVMVVMGEELVLPRKLKRKTSFYLTIPHPVKKKKVKVTEMLYKIY